MLGSRDMISIKYATDLKAGLFPDYAEKQKSFPTKLFNLDPR